MNPNSDDPNNHVPPISPGDDWDDLDGSTERSRIGLPPRRAERRLPPKKEALAEKAGGKARMPEPEPDAESSPQQDAGKMPGKISRKPRKKPARKDEEKEPGTDGYAMSPQGYQEIAVVLPHVKGGKRRRVNEINPAGDRSAARPAGIVVKVPAAEPDGEAKVVMQKRRRFSRGERADWGDKEGRASLKWMLLTGFGVMALVIMAVVISQRPGSADKREGEKSLYSKLAPAEDIPENSKDSVANEDTENLAQLANARPKAESIFAAYACARSPGDFIDLIHAPTRNREVIESKWKPLGMKPGWMPGGQSAWNVLDGKRVPFAILEGVLRDFTNFKAYFREEEGALKMDWKATFGYSSAEFSELKSGKGDGSEVRAWLSNVDFYTFSFPEGKYRSFRIMSPEGEMTIWGYVPTGGDLEKQLLELFQPGQITGDSQNEIQAVLRLVHRDGDSLPDQWLITEIVRLGWLDE